MSDTICRKFLETTERLPNKTAILYLKKGEWLEATWNTYLETVERAAAGLHQLGLKAGDRVAILANSRPEWAYLDMAVMGMGAITVPIYHNNTPEDVQFILENSTARFLIVDNTLAATRLGDAITSVKTVERTIVLDPPKPGAESDELLSFDHLLDLGVAQLTRQPRLYKEAALNVRINDIATMLYTSGTTGRPKGVVLTHSCIMSEIAEAFPLLGVTPRDRSLSFLPFAHVLGRIEIWGHVFIGYQMAYAESIERMRENLQSAKPTLIISVPRVFEKIYNSVVAQSEISGVKKRVFDWAVSIGRQISKYKIDKRPVPVDIALKYQLAKKLVFDKLSEKLGGNLRFAVCGGAPMSREIAEFFHAAGLLILEGYGLTETTGAVCVNTPFDYRFGTVGKPIGDVKVQIAEDGEVLLKSKKVMHEYYQDSQATHEAIKDGWFHTGDIGEISREGYLTITDRKKDLIKTAGGKYVAPQRLEGLLKLSQYISQVHIHGDQRKYIVALVTLNPAPIRAFADSHDISYKDFESLSQHPRVRELIRQAVAETNAQLASFETIKNFAILPKDFTIESGELTPSLKVKRKVVDQRHKDVIDKLYGVDKSN